MRQYERTQLARNLAGVLMVLMALAGGCNSQANQSTDGPPSGAGTQGAPCTSRGDCAGGFVCGYKISDGCSAQGTCVPVTPQPGQAACGALLLQCGCDGVTPVTGGCNFFSDYAPAPVMPGVSHCPGDAATSADSGLDCSGWGAICGKTCCDGLVCMGSSSSALPGICVKP